MDKNDEVVAMLLNLRDELDDIIDMLVPPPAEETHESAMSEAPPPRGVATCREATRPGPRRKGR